MNDIINYIYNATLQTQRIFKCIDAKQLNEFKNYLEDAVLFDVISCNEKELNLDKNKIPNSIKTALIASGISENGILPMGKGYDLKSISITSDAHHYAKRRIIEIEKERLNGTYKDNMDRVVSHMRESYATFPIISKLVELGILQNERNCGYIQDSKENTDFFEGVTQATWLIQEQLLEYYGLKDSIVYGICSDIYKRPQAQHYSLAATNALSKMAEIDLLTEIEGLDEYSDYEGLRFALRNIEAAKVSEPELIKKYEKRFKDKMRTHIKELNRPETGKKITKKM